MVVVMVMLGSVGEEVVFLFLFLFFLPESISWEVL